MLVVHHPQYALNARLAIFLIKQFVLSNVLKIHLEILILILVILIVPLVTVYALNAMDLMQQVVLNVLVVIFWILYQNNV